MSYEAETPAYQGDDSRLAAAVAAKFVKVLGQQDVPQPVRKASDARMKAEAPQEPAAQTRRLDEWTFMVNLSGATNPDPDAPDGRRQRPFFKLGKLKELAGMTKDKPVTLVVQCVTDPKDKDDPAASPVLERYLIRDGKVQKLSETPSHGFAADAEDFIALGKQYPSKKFGIISEHHGQGNAGVKGDNGPCSLDEAVAAMERGLAKAGRKRADLLDWDSCLMSQDGVVERCKRIATNMIASSEIEKSEPEAKVDAQNLNAELKLVLDNPFIDGRQLGKSIIDISAKGVHDGTLKFGERTVIAPAVFSLAHIDLEKANEFRVALDTFGDTMAACLKVKNNHEVIEKIISDTPHLGRTSMFASPDEAVKGDLKSFVEKVQSACKDGTITDQNGKVADACRNLLAAHKHLVPEAYGLDCWIDYGSQGGLSVFLPQEPLTNPADTARGRTHFGNIIDTINQSGIKSEDLIALLGSSMSRLAEDQKFDQDRHKLKPLEDAFERVKASAGRPNAFRSALLDMRAIATQLLELPAAKAEFAEIKVALEKERDKTYKEELLDDNGWNRFIKALGH